MRGRPWTCSGRGDREEVTWWGPSSISTMRNGSGGVRKPEPHTLTHGLTNTDAVNNCSVLFSDSGVGAGIDSYYEYLMKAYILLGDDVFLERFNVVSPPSLHVHFFFLKS